MKRILRNIQRYNSKQNFTSIFLKFILKPFRLVGVAPIENKMRENRLRWFGYIECRSGDAPVRRMEKIDIAQGKKLRERPKMT